ncbi:MAG: phosphohistidine phosphatase SixA [Candidatus Sericytochromatia bacterium]|nr:phosphohistidine phosphatase SixA [Candidatus Tanganyikabacteria bacterium]
MRVFLFRHTEAVDAGAATDADRWLTPAGRKAARKAAKRLRRLDVRWDSVLTSPLVRAVQTAEIAAARLKGKAAVTVADCLRPGKGSWDAFRAAAAATGGAAVALVGHEPDLGAAVGQALGTAPIALAKGAIAALEVDKGGKVTSFGLLAPGAEDWAPLSGPPAARPVAKAAKAKPAVKAPVSKAKPPAAKPARASRTRATRS